MTIFIFFYCNPHDFVFIQYFISTLREKISQKQQTPLWWMPIVYLFQSKFSSSGQNKQSFS